jgi:hypothetical protein
MRRQAGKFKRRDVAAVVDAKNNRFPINPGGTIQHKGKRNLFGRTKRYHRTEREPVLRKVAHHAAVGGRKFDVDEAQRAFSKLSPALGFQGHGSTC